MISVFDARLVVVCDRDFGSSVEHCLRRMGLSNVRSVPALDDARRLCESDHIDGCLVILPRAVPDEVPRWSVKADAPGRNVGVPSLLVADVVTPYLARSARKSGYSLAIGATLPPRLLYRHVRALLQRGRRLPDPDLSRQRPGAQLAPVPVSAIGSPPGGKSRLQ